MLQKALPQVLQGLRHAHPQSPGDICLLDDAGQTITYLLDVLAQVATRLTHSPSIGDYVENRLDESAEDRELGDLDMDMVDYLEDKHAALK